MIQLQKQITSRTTIRGALCVQLPQQQSNMDYLRINREAWNKRTEVHAESEFYDIAGFLADKTTLRKIELSELRNVDGKTAYDLFVASLSGRGEESPNKIADELFLVRSCTIHYP